jgi:hypothetical protein
MEVGNAVHKYITSVEKGYNDLLVLEVASDKEEESTWRQAADSFLSPN